MSCKLPRNRWIERVSQMNRGNKGERDEWIESSHILRVAKGEEEIEMEEKKSA